MHESAFNVMIWLPVERRKRAAIKHTKVRAVRLRNDQLTEWRWNGRPRHSENGRQQRTERAFISPGELVIIIYSNGSESYLVEFTCTNGLWIGKQLDGSHVQCSEGSLEQLLSDKYPRTRNANLYFETRPLFLHLGRARYTAIFSNFPEWVALRW